MTDIPACEFRRFRSMREQLLSSFSGLAHINAGTALIRHRGACISASPAFSASQPQPLRENFLSPGEVSRSNQSSKRHRLDRRGRRARSTRSGPRRV